MEMQWHPKHGNLAGVESQGKENSCTPKESSAIPWAASHKNKQQQRAVPRAPGRRALLQGLSCSSAGTRGARLLQEPLQQKFQPWHGQVCPGRWLLRYQAQTHTWLTGGALGLQRHFPPENTKGIPLLPQTAPSASPLATCVPSQCQRHTWEAPEPLKLEAADFGDVSGCQGKLPAMSSILQAGSAVPVRRGGRSWEEGWLSREREKPNKMPAWGEKHGHGFHQLRSQVKQGWLDAAAEPRSAWQTLPRAVQGLLLPPGRTDSVQAAALSQHVFTQLCSAAFHQGLSKADRKEALSPQLHTKSPAKLGNCSRCSKPHK